MKPVNMLLNRFDTLAEISNRKALLSLYMNFKSTMSRISNIDVLDLGWATTDFLTDARYANITIELFKVDVLLTNYRLIGGVLPSLHWSRRFEYPWAVLNGKFLGSPKPFRILDCGAGLNPLQFFLAMRGYSVYSLDLNIGTLLRIGRIKANFGIQTIHPYYGDILRMPFPDNSFDRVICISVLEHVLSRYPIRSDTQLEIILRMFFNELLRVLKPEGLLLLTFDVNLNPENEKYHLYPKELEVLAKILRFAIPALPNNLLVSSNTPEGVLMGPDLTVFYMVLMKSKASSKSKIT